MTEVEKTSRLIDTNMSYKYEEEDEDMPLPGFRFHPTDEELVGFYLRRKVDKKKPIRIELIKQIDIYKYEPWDLPKGSNVGEKESYFFCKRGRKYRNSIRPNRVTGSGFWKATGIDRPIYSAAGSREPIGLKKSLVYYRGSAGKGTKTDWMMHEFRLPATDHCDKSTTTTAPSSQEAEVWTLCRIFKRNASYRKCLPDWRESSAKRNVAADHSNPKTKCTSFESEGYISFETPVDEKPAFDHPLNNYLTTSMIPDPSSSSTTTTNGSHFNEDLNQILKYGDWDDLRSVVEFAVDRSFLL